MSIFFQGWRRKLGIVTLAMACMSCLFWIRSYTWIEGVRFPVSDVSYDVYMSHGIVHIMKWDRPNDWRVYSKPTRKAIMRWSGPRAWKCAFRFWWVVTPLTLLSSYLLLGKPKPRIAKPNPPNSTSF